MLVDRLIRFRYRTDPTLGFSRKSCPKIAIWFKLKGFGRIKFSDILRKFSGEVHAVANQATARTLCQCIATLSAARILRQMRTPPAITTLVYARMLKRSPQKATTCYGRFLFTEPTGKVSCLYGVTQHADLAADEQTHDWTETKMECKAGGVHQIFRMEKELYTMPAMPRTPQVRASFHTLPWYSTNGVPSMYLSLTDKHC